MGCGCGKEDKMRDGVGMLETGQGEGRVGMLETGQGEGWGVDVGKRTR